MLLQSLQHNTQRQNDESTVSLWNPKEKEKREEKVFEQRQTRVLEARQEVQKAFGCYQVESTKENQKELQTKKRALQKTYDIIESEELKKEIQKVEEANVHYRHAESWKLANQIT